MFILHVIISTKDDLSELLNIIIKVNITMYGFKTDDYKNSGIVIAMNNYCYDIYKRNIKYGAWANGQSILSNL